MPIDTFILLGAIFVLYILFRIGVGYLRRLGRADRPDAPTNFTIAELSALRNQGLLTDEQLEKATQSILKHGRLPSSVGLPPIIVPPQASKDRGFDVLPPKPNPPDKPAA